MGPHHVPQRLGGELFGWGQRICIRILPRRRRRVRLHLRWRGVFILGGGSNGDCGLDPLQDSDPRGGALGQPQAHLGRSIGQPIHSGLRLRRRGGRHPQHHRKYGMRPGGHLLRLSRQRAELHGLFQLFEHVHRGPKGKNAGDHVLRCGGTQQHLVRGKPRTRVPPRRILAENGLPPILLFGILCQRRFGRQRDWH